MAAPRGVLLLAVVGSAAALGIAATQSPRCAEVETLVRRLPGLLVGPTRDTSLRAAWSGADDRPACQVRAVGHRLAEYATLDSLFDWLRSAGWREHTIYSADGPDGTVSGFHRGGMTCLIEGRWDGGDDSDSTYVPSDTLELALTCAATLPVDTTLPR